MRSTFTRYAALIVVVATLQLGGTACAQNSSGTLDHIRQTKTINLGYRTDAPPFSFQNNAGTPAGYIVDLCKYVVRDVQQQLKLDSLNINWVVVNASNRFDTIRGGRADLLCDPSTDTLDRRKLVDFSITTYVDGAGLLVRGDGPKTLQGLAGQQIGVLGATTTEEALRNTLKAANMTATVVPVKSYSEGLAMLDAGKISAYFADRSILESLATQSKDPSKLAIADNYLTIEPYGLALRRGDEDFRLAVDAALSRIYRSGTIAQIFNASFGSARPSPVLQTLYLITGLPE